MEDLTGHDWTSVIKQVMTVSASSYYGALPAWKALSGAWGSGQYWVTNATSTGWWKIDFGPYTKYDVRTVEIQVNTIPEPNRAPKDFTIKGSNNDSTWTTLKTVTNEISWGSGEKRSFGLTSCGNYRYYKIDITANNGDTYLQIGEVYFIGNKTDPSGYEDLAKHDWTGYTNDSMIISGSTYWGTHYPWRISDGKLGAPQYWLTNGVSAGWVKIDFGWDCKGEVEVILLQVNTIPEPNRAPKDFTIKGSNNDSTWTTLKTVTNEISWGSGEWREFALSPTGLYRYYKIDITANNGDAYLQLAEMYLYGDPLTISISGFFLLF